MIRLFIRWFWIFLTSMVLIESASALEACQNSVGKFVSIEGVIEIEHSGQRGRQPASLESSLCQDDLIYVAENSRAAVSLINDVVLRLDQNTTMRLVDVASQPEKRSLLELVVGAFKSFSRPPRTFAVNTPYLNGLIEGTEFAMRVEGNTSMTTVYEGKVTTSNPQGKLTLKRGETALAKSGQAPQPYLVVKPRDAVQWTLHFPPLFAALGGARQMPSDASPAVKQALALVAEGNTAGALTLLERVPRAEQNANYHLYRAALFLNVGRVGEARADIDTALAENPKEGLAYALLSVIEVVHNEHSQALASAEKAVALSPSAAAKIALSYAQQADFHLEAARDTLLSAVNEHPEDSLAWARLGELWLMFGEQGKALEAAKNAEKLAPDLARTHIVLGFAALSNNQIADAKISFERAIGLSSDDPLAHLGLGLAKIKRGGLAEGRKELEAAVAIDANNALLRSYLGKAYYAEKRSPLEGQQYSIAKELDPADPTPYFYDAIEKQTTNRPVEALQDMEKSLELNDNRAVYRSRLLLDSDLAARSASQARVYSDLGFQQRALVEGWKSVNTDPSNFSAHRFLADSYSVLPRHEIARVSELLQSQLLQPLNMTPIQPHLAESNLFLIGAGGPGALSFNEFNPIFNRDGVNFQTSGLIGSNNTYAGEGVLSGLYGNAAFSLGGFHSTSDGFRTNDKYRDDISNAFVQYEFSPKTSIQAEYRYRSDNMGDLRRQFFADNYSPYLNLTEDRNTYRVGGRHNFSESSTLLGSYIHQDAHFGNNDSLDLGLPDMGTVSIKRPEKSNGFELQHLFRSQFINLTSGAGYSSITGNINTQVLFPVPLTDYSYSDRTSTDLSHTNAYAYSNITPFKKVKLTLGVSGDFTGGNSPGVAGINQINPKAGITWEPLTGTTLRAAAFRTLKRTLITNQTLEPTQVAGFNQFYDDFNGTEAWHYGTAIDQKFTRTLFGGMEVSRRDLHVAYANIDPTGLSIPTRVAWQENMARSYLSWAPANWLALKAEYRFENYKRDINFADGVEHMNSHSVPLGFSIFHPSGLSSTLTTTYYNQDGVFDLINGQQGVSGNSSFWLVDTGLSYRLPKRYGIISVGANNIFNREFNYFDTDFNNPRMHSGRMIFGRVTLALP